MPVRNKNCSITFFVSKMLKERIPVTATKKTANFPIGEESIKTNIFFIPDEFFLVFFFFLFAILLPYNIITY